MKLVEFLKVGMENFCGFKSLMEYEFKNDKLLLIYGPNGIGKSTIFECLCYVLYGITPKGLTGDDVVNDEIMKNCYTYLTFKIGDDLYKAERSRKHYKLGDTALLSKNGEKPYKKGAKEVTAECEKLLLPKKLMENTILFGQKVKTFFTDLTDGDQKEIFRKVLQLDEYLLYMKETSKRLKKLAEDLVDLLNGISVNNQMIEQTKSQIQSYKLEQIKFEDQKKLDVNTYQGNIQRLTLEANNLRRRIEELYSGRDIAFEILESQKQLTDILLKIKEIEKNKESSLSSIDKMVESKKSALQNAYSESHSKLIEEKNSKTNAQKELYYSSTKQFSADLTDVINKISSLSESLLSLTKQKNKIESEIKQISSGLNGETTICFACNQVVGQDKIIHLKHMVEEKSASLAEIENLILESQSQIPDLELRKEKIKEELKKISDFDLKVTGDIESDFNIKLKALDDRLQVANKTVETLSRDKTDEINKSFSEEKRTLTSDYSTAKDLNESLIKEHTEKSELESRAKDLEIDVKTNSKLLEEVNKRSFNTEIFDIMNKKIHELSNKIKLQILEKEDFEKQKRVLEFWSEGFSNSGIPSMLIDEAIPFMNTRIKHYLELLGGRYLVSFDTQGETKAGEMRDKIAVRVLDTVTKSNSRKKFSGGQTRMVDVATIFTLHDLQSVVQDTKVNIILLDEIFDALDTTNVAYVSNLLRKLKNGKSISVISHTNIDSIECDEYFSLS